ncbi:MAG: hypothetical protein ACOY94_25530 [Bacillota bacterium]
MTPLPQEFPRELALLRLDDVLGDLPDEAARRAYVAAFEARRADPLAPGGLVIVGAEPAALRLVMALMRLTVLRFRDLNFERFEAVGGKERLLTAYVRGENLALPLPDRAGALFIERADRAEAGLAGALAGWERPLFATWEGPAGGPVWEALTRRCAVLKV